MGNICSKAVIVDKMEACSLTPPIPLSELSAKMFHIDLIREKILNYVIYDKNKILIPEVCSVRQVCKDWLLANTKELIKSQKAIFRIKATKENSTSGTAYVQQNGKILDQFWESVTLRQGMRDVPLYSITTSPHLLQHNNLEEFLDCLVELGDNLVELNFPFPTRHFPKPLQPNTSLSHLSSFSVDTLCTESIDNAINFIQSVFDASKQLKSLKLMWRLPTPTYISENWSNFVLPTTLTDIHLVCPLYGDHLAILLKAPLPNLKTLTLEGSPAGSHTGEQFSNILKHYRQTLEKFSLLKNTEDLWANIQPFSKLKLPVMEKLESFILENDRFELETGSGGVEQFLPVLKHLTLTKQTLLEFRKWVGSSHYDSVSSLTLSWQRQLDDERLEPGFSTVEKLSEAFPNIVQLDITYHHAESLENIRYLWNGLKSLRDLTIRLHSNEQLHNRNSLDALLTGLPEHRLDALKEGAVLQDELQLQDYPDSIRNLADLEKLHLEFLSPLDTSL